MEQNNAYGMRSSSPTSRKTKGADAKHIVFSSVFGLLFVVAALLFSCLGFPSTLNLKKSQWAAESYQGIESTYRVPGLSQDQISAISKRSDVTGILPYFSFSGTVSCNGKSQENDVYFLSDLDHMDLTAYREGRIYSKKATDNRKIFVDSAFASANACKVGQEVTIQIGSSSFSYQIYAIAARNFLDGAGVLHAEMDEEVQTALHTAFFTYGGFQYSSSYIACSDKTGFYNYIKGYKPEGTRLPREAFASDKDYGVYTLNFDATDYSKNIQEIAPVLAQRSDDAATYAKQYAASLTKLCLLLGAALLGVSVLWILFTIFYLRRISSSTSNEKPYVKTALLSGGASLGVSLLVFAIAVKPVSAMFNLTYAPAFMALLPAGLVILIIGGASLLTNSLLSKKVIKRG